MGVYHIKTWHRQVADLFNRLQLIILKNCNHCTSSFPSFCVLHLWWSCILTSLFFTDFISPHFSQGTQKRAFYMGKMLILSKTEVFLLCLQRKTSLVVEGKIFLSAVKDLFIYLPWNYKCRRRTTQAVELIFVVMVLTQANSRLQ